MRRTPTIVIVVHSLCILLASRASAQQPNSAQHPNYEVTTSDATVPSPSVNWLDVGSIQEPARSQLLALYSQEFALIQQLNAVRWVALHDTLGGLLQAGFAVNNSQAGSVVEESAARAGHNGATYKGVNPALDAQTPVEMYESVNRAMSLVRQIVALEKEILGFKKSHHIDLSLQTPWNKLFPKSKTLTPDQVVGLLTPAANAVVPTSCGYLIGYASNSLSACMNLACVGGCDGATVSQCQSSYPRDLAWEQKAMAQCIASNAPTPQR